MSQVIAIKKLNHYYQEGKNQKQILFGIDLDIYPKEVVILTGASGSGKTTLLSLIGCMRSVQEGSLQVLDHELKGANEIQRMQIRRGIGYVFQHFNLLDFMTVQQNVMVSLELQDNFTPQEARSQSTEILKAVGLGQHLSAYPRDLSGGQKQRVAIARALVHRPRLLLADEPTSALDRQTGQEVTELMTTLAKEQGSAVLIVTHDSRIFGASDRIVRMEDGKLDVDYEGQLSVALPTLTDKQLIQLIPKLKMLTFQPGEIVIRQGEVADKFYILIEGEVEIIQEFSGSESKLLQTLGPNNYFGEIGLLHETTRKATVRAAHDAAIKVIAIDRSDFHEMVVSSKMTHALLDYQAIKLFYQDELQGHDELKLYVSSRESHH
ncbi:MULTISPECIES: ATP-binding cassette domain-containing protein [Nostoc]|uniref:ATP-binding cassette domain-containing protein n=2 Tax=Nostoc TaxID=1177 RepID=A0ABR8IA97_9NOSO|nr:MULTISPECIES: ATP-binding cassette domain-containing protein [Nostoc]MBD2563049.1 ATP-binding cassette domain-containing protein [Nostoc linckia FACHB-391]MBD2648134.1 ATP-binding cassette domain-containing protein [Nostoc foliaceum FACHB-393]